MAQKLILDGKEYPMPDMAEITMGQARIIKRYTGMSLQQLGASDGTDPDVIAAFCHLAIAADNPAKSFGQVEKEVEAISFAKLEMTGDEDDGEDEEDPPASTQSGSGDEPPRSGGGSDPSSGEIPEPIQLRTGTQA